jgi:hypothetical protein
MKKKKICHIKSKQKKSILIIYRRDTQREREKTILVVQNLDEASASA